jgi:riboflavin synthase
MFTGIIEAVGKVIKTEQNGTNRTFWITSSISSQLKVDQSLSHNGVCLTIESLSENSHRITAIEETLLKTNLDDWTVGHSVNLERCIPLNGRLDGHLVQGHVDTTALCILKEEKQGSWNYQFQFPEEFGNLVIEKGSICLNGISLTVFNVTSSSFFVAIIPYTYEHTTIKYVEPGSTVNIEFDLIGKYVSRHIQASVQHLNRQA